MTTDKTYKTYNLINSVKGGCGKTTLSMWLAYSLENSLLIDMDLLGTSMQALIYGDDKKSHDTAYTNDVFHGVENNKKKFVERVDLENGKCINLIFASMEYKEKDQFKAGKQSGYTPVVKHSMFRMGLRNLLKHHKTISGNEVEHFIFDMPPNSDGFSDAAMECIFNKKYSDLDKEDRKNLFMVIGADWGQTVTTINALKTLLLNNEENRPDRIFLVINSNLGDKYIKEDYYHRKEKIEATLNTWSLDEAIKKDIVFLKMEHNRHYTELGIAGIGLKDADANEIGNAFNAVVVASAMYGEDFKDFASYPPGHNKLKKLILGEDDEQ